jgi:hypothetical protein
VEVEGEESDVSTYSITDCADDDTAYPSQRVEINKLHYKGCVKKVSPSLHA